MKLGTKLVISLVTVVVLIMAVHGYFSDQQEREGVERELRVGMRGFTRMVNANLRATYADKLDNTAMQRFIDTAAPRGNIHAVIVYDLSGREAARSESVRYGLDFPELDPTPILQLDPTPVLKNGRGVEGYIRDGRKLVYYRIEPLLDSSDRQLGAFVIARQGFRLFANIDERRNRIIATTSSLVLVLSLLILVIVRRSVSRPINALIERIRAIAKGQWKQRIEITGRDEIASLASEFNLMSEELEQSHTRLLQEQEAKFKLQQDLRHSERLASVGRLAAGLAHEIGTPLNIISGRAEYLLRRPRSSEEVNDNLQVIHSQSDRITAIVRQLLEFSRRREPQFRPVDFPAMVKNVEHLLEHQLKEKKIQVELKVPADLPNFRADPELLQQAFINLFSNAMHAINIGGTITISANFPVNGASATGLAGGSNYLRIIFEDNGAGITPEHLGRVFDPFFTTKDVGEGSGLGLSVTYGIIKDHSGEIHVESQLGKFTRFVIDLPAERRLTFLESSGTAS